MENEIKYPRTYHLPYSEKTTSDDKRLENDHMFGDMLRKRYVVVMEKMDGENTSITMDKVWARSLNSNANDEGRRWIDRVRTMQQELLKMGYRLCGENMFYKHTIEYNNLETAFYGFSIWRNETCLSWENTKALFDEFNIKTPKIIFEGLYDKDKIMELYKEIKSQRPIEGFVVRDIDSFELPEFPAYVAKFVDKDFIIDTTEKHWNSTRAKKEVNNFVESIWNINY